jgi:hypothetical protein
MHFSFRQQFRLLEGLRPTPGAKQTTKKTENQFNEDVVGLTLEAVEPPAKFEHAMGCGQMDYEQTMFQVLPTEEIMSHGYDTFPAGTLVPIPQTENKFNEDIMGPIWDQGGTTTPI